MKDKYHEGMGMTCQADTPPGGNPPDKDVDKEMACGAGGNPDDITNPEGALGTPKPEAIFTEGDPGRGNDIRKMSLSDLVRTLLDEDTDLGTPIEKIIIGDYGLLPRRPLVNPQIPPKDLLYYTKDLNDFLQPDPIAFRSEEARLRRDLDRRLDAKPFDSFLLDSEMDAAFKEFQAKVREGKFNEKLPPELLAALGIGKSRPDINSAAKAKNPIEEYMEERLKDDLIKQNGRKK